MIKINRITNANIYLNGGNLLGKADEVVLPNMKLKMVEVKALGMFGAMEFPAGMDKLESKIKWNSFYDDVWVQAMNPFSAVQLMIRGSVETYTSAGRVSEIPLVSFVVGQFKGTDMGTFKQHDNAEFESMLSTTACKQIYNGTTILEYDALSNIYRVNGVNLLAQYKINIGG